MQYIGIYFVFSMHLGSSAGGVVSCCRHYGLLLSSVAGCQKDPIFALSDDFMDIGAWGDFSGIGTVDGNRQ